MGYLRSNVLASSAGYVAGFVDPEVGNRSDLFDVYVNLPDSVITVSQSAKGTVRSQRKQDAVRKDAHCIGESKRYRLMLVFFFLNMGLMSTTGPM